MPSQVLGDNSFSIKGNNQRVYWQDFWGANRILFFVYALIVADRKGSSHLWLYLIKPWSLSDTNSVALFLGFFFSNGRSICCTGSVHYASKTLPLVKSSNIVILYMGKGKKMTVRISAKSLSLVDW